MENITEEKRRSLRDLFWVYPDVLRDALNRSRPLGAIIVAAVVAVQLFFLLTNPRIFSYFELNPGNTVTEGTVGQLDTLNPIFVTQNHISRDLFEMTFDKLVYIDREGEPQPGIAKSWDVTNNGREYLFHLDPERVWHDGEPITADDVTFTFERARTVAQEGGTDTIASTVENVDVVADGVHQVRFTLSESNATFFEAVSVYVVPQHIMEELDADQLYRYGRSVPFVGSGPYRVTQIEDSFVQLNASERYPTRVGIQSYIYRFYASVSQLEVAFKNNLLDIVNNLPSEKMAELAQHKGYNLLADRIETRKKVIYFNVGKEPLDKVGTRRFLSQSLSKENLIESLELKASQVFSPIPTTSWAFDESVNINKYNLKAAQKTSKDMKYTPEKPLILTLTYLDNDKNTEIAQYLKEEWKQVNVDLKLKPVTYESLINEVLATRNFELLLSEIETTVDPDQYNLWHSTKTNYPDLNISGYEYTNVDILLERARVEDSRASRKEDYELFQLYLAQDLPVIFLYEPHFEYLVRDDIEGVDLKVGNYPAERYRNVEVWKR